jgi:hypothetical protein
MGNKTADIKKLWGQVNLSIELNKIQRAQDLINKGLGLLGTMTMNGLTEVNGESLDKWKNRFWLKLDSIGGFDIGDDMDSVSDEEIYSAFVS